MKRSRRRDALNCAWGAAFAAALLGGASAARAAPPLNVASAPAPAWAGSLELAGPLDFSRREPSWAGFPEVSTSIAQAARAGLAAGPLLGWSRAAGDSVASAAPPPAAEPTAQETDLAPFLDADALPTERPAKPTAVKCPDGSEAPGPDRPCATPTTPRRKLHDQLWFVTLELFTVQSASLAIFAALPSDVSGFVPADIRNIGRFAAMGPHFDDDRWGFNYVGHPLSGSEYYLIARNRGAAYWQGMLYAAAWSTFWEYISEGLYERASIQDLIVTPVAGAALGELRYRLRRALADPVTKRPPNAGARFLMIALDPVQSLSEVLPL